MKQNLLLKSALLLVALFSGASSSWADPAETFSIPQDLGDYILIGQDKKGSSGLTADGVTLTGCKVDGGGTCYTIGSTNGSPMKIEFTLTAEEGNYLFSFKSGAKDASTVSLSLTNSSSEVVWSKASESIEDTDNWSLTKSHDFVIGDLSAGNYTMTITGVSKMGDYYGNFGNFCFHKSTQYANNWNNTTDVNFADAYLSGLTLNGTYLTNIDAGDYVEYYSYAPNTACYNLDCGIGYSTAGTDHFTITITDVATSTAEVDAVNYTVVSSNSYPMTSNIDEGWKKIRLAFPTQPANGSCRVEHVKYNAFAQLPLMGAGGVNTYLALNSGTFGRTASAKYNHDPAYESENNNIGYNGDGGYAEFYVGNSNETAYYDFHIGTSRYQEATFTLTITDVATSTVEVNQSGLVVPSGQSYTDQTYKLTNAITPGLKKIRIETASESNSYAFNYKNVTFYKRSLNENYDYTPVAATGVDVVLTRSITANKWSTIVLPFNLPSSQIETVFGTGASVAQFTGVDGADESTLKFTTTLTDNEMKANQPYAIKVASDFSTATISGVTIVSGTPTQGTTKWNFEGTYTSGNIPEGSYFFQDNQLFYAEGSGNTIKPFRAYFRPDGVVGVRGFVGFSVDGQTTGIHSTLYDSTNKGDGKIYSLSGQIVTAPQKGVVYIVDGKKVIFNK